MNALTGKKVILGISGSIAAYKSAVLVRLLIKSGASVKVVMTSSATDFISPLTLSTLSRNEVFSSVSSEDGWHNHVELGLWADVMVVAPATANTLAKMANGICDNMLSAVYLSARCPVCVAPAMDLDMWAHPSTQSNVERLQKFGNHLIPVESGELASGLVGKGRMAEPEHIISFLEELLADSPAMDLEGKKILITSGPTLERIDPVRFISNHSSGKMGSALALEAAKRGAEVLFITGPAKHVPSGENIRIIHLESAEEMYHAAVDAYPMMDAAILAAAVADYTPEEVSGQKIKKKDDDLLIRLKRTEDIAKALGKLKSAKQINIGFALETEKERSNAQAKLEKKNFDFIVLNSLNDKGAGFGYDTNKISILDKNGSGTDFELKSKQHVARDIVDKLVSLF